jgi:exopolysaccharide production protein ExoZ
VFLEVPAARLLPAWLLLLGDASYSLYLSHGFVIPVVYGASRHAHLAGSALMLSTVIGSLVASAVFAVALYLGVERPMLRWMKGASARPARVPFIAGAGRAAGGAD